MPASFDFTVEPRRSTMRITMAGFFEAPDIARFTAERDRTIASLGCAPNRHCTLVDIRGMAIQSQDTVVRFRDILSQPWARSRRIAFVVGASLARMQTIRAAAGRDARFFSDMAEAEAWLAQDGGATIAA